MKPKRLIAFLLSLMLLTINTDAGNLSAKRPREVTAPLSAMAYAAEADNGTVTQTDSVVETAATSAVDLPADSETPDVTPTDTQATEEAQTSEVTLRHLKAQALQKPQQPKLL